MMDTFIYSITHIFRTVFRPGIIHELIIPVVVILFSNESINGHTLLKSIRNRFSSGWGDWDYTL